MWKFAKELFVCGEMLTTTRAKKCNFEFKSVSECYCQLLTAVSLDKCCIYQQTYIHTLYTYNYMYLYTYIHMYVNIASHSWFVHIDDEWRRIQCQRIGTPSAYVHSRFFVAVVVVYISPLWILYATISLLCVVPDINSASAFVSICPYWFFHLTWWFDEWDFVFCY